MVTAKAKNRAPIDNLLTVVFFVVFKFSSIDSAFIPWCSYGSIAQTSYKENQQSERVEKPSRDAYTERIWAVV